MAMRGNTVHKDHTTTLYIIELSPIFHNVCLSWPYLGKYKKHWNETLYIHICQRESAEDKNHSPIKQFTWVTSP